MKYAFIKTHKVEFSVVSMCCVLKLNRKGFYSWLQQPLSNRALDDQQLLSLIKASYVVSGGTYSSPWIHRDLSEASERCSVHRLTRIMREYILKAQFGFKRRYIKDAKPAKIADNLLDRQFSPDHPNLVWVSDITYVQTYEGFLYVATVIDLFSCRIVGWTMDKHIDRHLAFNALLMAIWQQS